MSSYRFLFCESRVGTLWHGLLLSTLNHHKQKEHDLLLYALKVLRIQDDLGYPMSVLPCWIFYAAKDSDNAEALLQQASFKTHTILSDASIAERKTACILAPLIENALGCVLFEQVVYE